MTALELRDQTITFRELQDQIQNHKRLSDLTLDRVTLYGDRDDLRHLCLDVLHGHSTLERVVLRHLKVSNGDEQVGQLYWNIDDNSEEEEGEEEDNVELNYFVSTFLVDVPYLSYLSLEHNPISSSTLCCIWFGKRLRKLRIMDCQLTDKDALLIARLAARLPRLDTIDLSDHDLSDHACQSARIMLKENSEIRSIRIHSSSEEENAEAVDNSEVDEILS